DNTIIQFLNRAQERLWGLLTSKDKTFMSKCGTIDLVANQNVYDLPTDVFLTNRIISVEWSPGNSTIYPNRPYKVLKQIMPQEQTNVAGYWIQKNKLYVSPMPTA